MDVLVQLEDCEEPDVMEELDLNILDEFRDHERQEPFFSPGSTDNSVDDSVVDALDTIFWLGNKQRPRMVGEGLEMG